MRPWRAAPTLADPRPASATIVLITCNRLQNVRLALKALEQQTTTDFAVVIADDGSTDGTRDAIDELACASPWRGRLRWVAAGLDPTGSSRPRNVGTANAAPGTSLIIFMDSDVLLTRNAVKNLTSVHVRHPGAALFATVHWLPSLEPAHIAERIESHGADGLLELVPQSDAQRVEGTIVGPDARPKQTFSTCPVPREVELRPELALFTCAAVPLPVFREAGGFDENLRGYGYEDMEFGIRLAERGVRAVLLADVVALHVWHAKPDWPAQSLEAERNLDYVLRKHGLDATSDHWADWSIWWHYHADRGGRVIRGSDGRPWAVDRLNRFRLALPSDTWVSRLGHEIAEPAAPGELERLHDAGEARPLSIERDG
jgi:GT2 family glycosyltransferase